MKSVVFTLKNQLGDFTKKEKQVARFIIKYPQVVIDSNAKQVADQVGTSAATVIRLAKRVCKNGLPELKERLKNETMVNDKFFEEIDPADTLEVMKQKMEYRINHTIEQTNRTVKCGAVRNAAKLVDQADVFYTFGMGASHLVADDLQQKFVRLGKPVAQTQDVHLLAAGMSKGRGVVVLISNSGETKETLQLLSAARALDLPVVAITRVLSSPLARQSTVVLAHSDSGEGNQLRSAATTSLMAQLYVVDLLYYSFLKLHFEDNVDQLTKSRRIIKSNF